MNLDSLKQPDPAKLKRFRELAALKQQRYAQRVAFARRDYRAFAEYVLKDESTGEGVKLAPIHNAWIEHVHFAWSRGLHAVILAPYAHGKTAHFSIGMPLFMFGQSTALRLILVSANDSIARERLVAVRNYIDHSEEYHELFPTVRANEEQGWTKGHLFLQRPTMSKDPSIIACGVTSSAIGRRCDVLILDDVNDARNTLHQPGMRDVIWRNYTGQLLSRLEPHGRVIVIACLTGDSPVLMQDGSWKPLSTIQAGDYVMSWKKGEPPVAALVKAMISQGTAPVYEVRTGNHVLRGTAEHPLLIDTPDGPSWCPLGQLKHGDRVYCRSREAYRLETIRSVTQQDHDVVYDLVVEPTGNFIAGGFVVHNTRWHEQDLVGRILEDDNMRMKYAFLIQRVADDFSHITCETIAPALMREAGYDNRRTLDQLFALYEQGAI